MFFIRADGNEKIGMGHVMRCLSIASALKKEGQQVLFVTADEKPAVVIRSCGFAVQILGTDYQDMEAELPSFRSLIKEKQAKIIVDSYYVTKDYLRELRKFAQVILLDDNFKEVYPVDALINYNIYGKTLGYEAAYPAETKLFLGCDYMPLREEFAESVAWKKEKTPHILLTTGGSDGLHIALQCMELLFENIEGKERFLKLQKAHWHVVCGPYCTDNDAIKAIAGAHKNITVHENVTRMSDVMLQCDLAISAAGSTLYELCALGIPTVGFYFADNQKQNMESFAELTPVANAGDVRLQGLTEMVSQMETLLSHPEKWADILMQMRKVVDGQGAGRLAKALMEMK